MENKKMLSVSILILATSIIFGSIWIGQSLEKFVGLQTTTSISTATNNMALTLSQVAEYMNITEEDFRSIIQIEKMELEKTGGFTGKMVPYFTINNKQYFYKNEVDEWLKDVSIQGREYNTIEGWLLQ